ncbi:MAG: hypothetical protein KJ607_07050 [Bacteroidetes bacterium]|nr:hypothetical protein [Bacteroidota bacterium]
MKTILSLLTIAVFAATTTYATVRQVDNNATNPGVYTTIQAAQNAASAGDTLYIHASPTQYAAANIEKQLTIIGEGALPDKKFGFETAISTINFQFNSANTVSSSGSRLYGCCVGAVNVNTNSLGTVAVNNITIQRNKIQFISCNGNSNSINAANSGLLVSNNVIMWIGGGVIYNSIIRNNIITGSVGGIGSESIGSWILTNNVILNYIYSCRSAEISNNIFYVNVDYAFSDNEYCTIINNCIFDYTGVHTYTTGEIINGTSTGSNNLLNVDPQFENADVNIYSYSYTYPTEEIAMANFRLQAGSPCLTAGSDGLELGMYGGLVPFFEGIPNDSRFRYFPMPNIPAVLDITIFNSTVLPDGILNVGFISRKQN